MARGKKKHRPGGQKKKAPTPTPPAKEEVESDDSDQVEETALELTTEQELALEAKAKQKAARAAKAVARARKKKEREEIASMPGPSQVTLRHILIKHKEARNSFSKRTLTQVNKTKAEATNELSVLLNQLKEVPGSDGDDDVSALEKLFSSMAMSQSDCGTHVTGGKMKIKRRQMDVRFENVAWNTEIGRVAPSIIETESGCHILMRVG
jgi:parvulin-like peptidyl-prolyl isomerase